MNILQDEIKFWRMNDCMQLITERWQFLQWDKNLIPENNGYSTGKKVQFHCVVVLQTVTMYRHYNSLQYVGK